MKKKLRMSERKYFIFNHPDLQYIQALSECGVMDKESATEASDCPFKYRPKQYIFFNFFFIMFNFIIVTFTFTVEIKIKFLEIDL